MKSEQVNFDRLSRILNDAILKKNQAETTRLSDYNLVFNYLKNSSFNQQKTKHSQRSSSHYEALQQENYQQALQKLQKSLESEFKVSKVRQRRQKVQSQSPNQQQIQRYQNNFRKQVHNKRMANQPREIDQKKQELLTKQALRQHEKLQQKQFKQALDEQVRDKRRRQLEDKRYENDMDRLRIANDMAQFQNDQNLKQIKDMHMKQELVQQDYQDETSSDQSEALDQVEIDDRERIMKRYEKIMGKSRMKSFLQPQPQKEQPKPKVVQKKSFSEISEEDALKRYQELMEKEEQIRQEKQQLQSVLEDYQSRASRGSTRQATVSRVINRSQSPNALSKAGQSIMNRSAYSVVSTPKSEFKTMRRPKKQQDDEEVESLFKEIFND